MIPLYKSLLLESDKDELQKRLTPEFPGTCGWDHSLTSSPHLDLLLTTATPAKKLKPEFSGVADSLDCQTNPLPAPGAFCHAAMKANLQRADPLPIPPS